nr:Mu-like prophage protein (COG3941) [uncultured Mediterranean phage uvMED]
MASQKLNIDIVARDKTTKAMNSLKGGLARVKGAVFNLQNAFIGLGAGLVIRNLVNTGKELENLQVRLKFLLKDTNEGAKAFDNMVKFASKVPFSLEEIQSGSGILATVTDNAEDLQNMLEITGNVAAVTGLDFRTAAEQIQRSFSAGIGAADLFREKGVRNMLGFKAGATVSIEDTVKAFEKVFGKGGRFGKATDELAETFTGTLSMIGDKIFNFKKTILEAGLFETLKKEFGALDKFLEENSKQIDQIAQDIGIVLGMAVKKVADGIIVLKNNMNIFKNLVMVLISVKVVTLFSTLAIAISNVAKAMMTFGFASIFTKGGLIGIAKMVAKGGAIFVAFKGMEKLFEDMAKDFEKVKFEIKNTLPDARDFHKTMIQTKKALFDVAEVEEKIRIAKEKELKLQNFLLEEQNKKRLKFHELESEGVEKFKQQNDIQGSVLEKIKEQNEQFSLSSEIFNTITSLTSKVSRSIAEAVVLGKSLNMSFKELAQNLLVDVLAKMIERIMLLTIEKLIVEKIFKQDTKKLQNEKNITKEKQKQVVLQAMLMAMGGGSGGGGGFKFFDKGGAVSKGQPVVVGERGAELFIPNSSGQITQSARGTGGGAVNVNFTINTIDSRGFDQALIENRGTISSIINSALAEKGRGELI